MSNKELDKDSEASGNFNNRLIYILAQDLKQPFSSMIMMAEMLKLIKEPLGQREFNQVIGDLKNTASKSLELLGGLLYWIRSKEENFEFKVQPLLLSDLVDEANNLYAIDQQKKNISFFNIIPQLQLVYAHKQMLLFITRNILSNIIAYSPTGSSIGVTAVADEKWVTVAFTGHGQGIAGSHLNELFNINEDDIKIDPELRRWVMIMSICQDMIQQMNGRLWMGSAEDEGTTFYYALQKERL